MTVLRDAKALIDTPEKWWDGRCGGFAPDGQHCALQAIRVASRHRSTRVRASVENTLVRAMGVEAPAEIPGWNDSHTHAEVMAAFDTAMAYVEARDQEFTVTTVTPERELVAA